jgi:hypothetical protein
VRLSAAGALSAVLIAAGTAALAGPGTARATEPKFGGLDAPIRPGIRTDTGGGKCTSNFVFTDKAGRVYLGQAGHCAKDPADESAPSADTCDYGRQLPIGTSVGLGDTGIPGRLAYSSWLTMQENGETDLATCRFNDFSLVRVPDEVIDRVNPTVPVFGGPTGLNTDGVHAGDLMTGWGNSPLWQDLEPLHPKRSVAVESDPSGRAHWIYSFYPGVPGDSGGPYLDPQGRAIGSLSELSLDPPGANIITDIARALAYAERYSGITGLRLVAGTAPFTG